MASPVLFKVTVGASQAYDDYDYNVEWDGRQTLDPRITVRSDDRP